MMYLASDLLSTVTGGAVGNQPQNAQSVMSDIGEKVAPSSCNGELGFGVMLTAAEVGLHAPGPWFVKMGAAATGAVGGLAAGCRMGNRPPPGK
jgi:hypothetical protein